MKILILAGGRSKRMGQPKATLERPDGTRQLDHLVQLIRPIADEILLSTNSPELAMPGVTPLPDLTPGAGPLAALEAFHDAFPDEPVLLLGCDLFLLDGTTLHHLLDQHESSSDATCFANRIDHRPEPLCTIYEPTVLARASKAVSGDDLCARHFLEGLDPRVIDLPNPTALDNANTPGELSEIFAKLQQGVSAKEVRVIYFAKLRESRGIDEETVESLACTAAGLYEEIRFRHRFPLAIDTLRCARNGEFCDWSDAIETHDEIVFIPPVAGG